MAFVYETVGKENRELWESIGWRDWGNRSLEFASRRKWCIDKEKNVYMQPIGGYIDMPTYYDFSYKKTIVRTEAFYKVKNNEQQELELIWNVDRIYIPRSLWNERQEILKLIEEAFMSDNCRIPLNRIKCIKVHLRCEPEYVEVDYNGR